MIVAGWVCLLWAAASASTEKCRSADTGSTLKTVFKEVGDKVVLEPGITYVKGNIVWHDNSNIAVEWEGGELDIKRHFKGRTSLNTTSGELTITGLTRQDSALYTPEVNDAKGTETCLIVIFPVPAPTVLTSCDAEMTSCVLTCDGTTTDAGEVAYTWNIGGQVLKNSLKEQRISEEDSMNITQITCELENAVSKASSPSIRNPFATERDIPPPDNLKISAGLTVFITMLAVVLLLVLIHRWKAGRWFYEEDHLPCQSAFWKRNVGEDPAQNGSANQEREEADEQTAMT